LLTSRATRCSSRHLSRERRIDDARAPATRAVSLRVYHARNRRFSRGSRSLARKSSRTTLPSPGPVNLMNHGHGEWRSSVACRFLPLAIVIFGAQQCARIKSDFVATACITHLRLRYRYVIRYHVSTGQSVLSIITRNYSNKIAIRSDEAQATSSAVLGGVQELDSAIVSFFGFAERSSRWIGASRNSIRAKRVPCITMLRKFKS